MTMNKRSIFVIIALIIVLIITGCSYEKKDKTSDALKFKEEYESLNGKHNNNKTYRTLDIDENNPIEYADYDKLLEVIENGTGIRTVLWVSSCFHNCKDCHNPVTHDPEDGVLFDEESMKEILDDLNLCYANHIFQQF